MSSVADGSLVLSEAWCMAAAPRAPTPSTLRRASVFPALGVGRKLGLVRKAVFRPGVRPTRR